MVWVRNIGYGTGMEDGSWPQTELRGRALIEEAACRFSANHGLDGSWLRSAARWLAEVAPAWEDMTGSVPVTRTYRPICSSMHLEAWLIAWPAGGRLELHDHGGASGALQVLRGNLVEEFAPAGPVRPDRSRVLRRPLRRRALGRGDSTAFDADYVHDVINGGGPLATSVHVYGPAVRPMAFYNPGRAVLRVLPAETDGADIIDGRNDLADAGSERHVG